MDSALHHTQHLDCRPHEAWRLLTEPDCLTCWLAPGADVDVRVGGRYELYWDLANRDHDSTIGCRVTALAEPELIAFEWKGPTRLQPFAFMNEAGALTHVTIALVPSRDGGTTLHLVHSGWRVGQHWAEAREWFAAVWASSLRELAAVAAPALQP